MDTTFAPEPQMLRGGPCWWEGLAGELEVGCMPFSDLTLLISQMGGILPGFWLCCSAVQD